MVESARDGDADPNRRVAKALDDLLCRRIARSGLVVASTLLVTLYFRLPAALYGLGFSAARHIEEFLDSANVVSVFWSMVLTLTLAAVYAPQAMDLRSLVSVQLGQLLNTWADAGSRLSVLVKKTEAAVSTLAPVLVAVTTNLH